MKWHKLLMLFACATFIAGVMAQDIELPEDIDDEELDEDEDILRMLEEKRIVNGNFYDMSPRREMMTFPISAQRLEARK